MPDLDQERWREDRLPKLILSEDRLPKPRLSPSPPPPSNEEESLVRPGYYVFARELPPPIRGTLTKTGELAFRGGSGDVYRGLWSPPDAKAIPVVIKCVRPLDNSQKENFETRIKRETTIWRMVKHRNILPFMGYQIVNEVPMLVSPWCENGNLATYIDANPELTRNNKLELLRGAARGLVYLHSLSPPIYHGDIKPQNVLVHDNLEAMLCDFGISRFILTAGEHSGFTTSDTCSGTSGYKAREILDESDPTTATDVYAFSGLILATMSGKPPFWKKKTSEAKVVAIVMGHIPNPADHLDLPEVDPLWNLMRKCWSAEPGSRPHTKALANFLEAEIADK
ncbi:hypothetical protein FRC05_001911 [Tulasnella sp. 425]|nr:hypothetical protein FRC05_001911 [Tulasnella sp. 425]